MCGQIKAGTAQAGKKAQTRMELIARTEILRAHNQGCNKFYDKIGVKKLEWLTVGDERTCEECESKSGKTYPIGKFPNIPGHPGCRCSSLPVITYSQNLLSPKEILKS